MGPNYNEAERRAEEAYKEIVFLLERKYDIKLPTVWKELFGNDDRQTDYKQQMDIIKNAVKELFINEFTDSF